MPNRFSSGKFSISQCDRCGFRFKLKKLKTLTIKTKNVNILVCPECWEQDHPQLQLGLYPVNDPQAVRNPRPDLSYPQSRSYTEAIYIGPGLALYSGVLTTNGRDPLSIILNAEPRPYNVEGNAASLITTVVPVAGTSFFSGGMFEGGMYAGGYFNVTDIGPTPPPAATTFFSGGMFKGGMYAGGFYAGGFTANVDGALLQENGDFILLESNDRLLLG